MRSTVLVSATMIVTAASSSTSFADSRSLPDKVFVFDSPPYEIRGEEPTRSTRLGSDGPIVLRSRSEEMGKLVFFSTEGDCQHTLVHPVVAVFRNGEWNTVSFDAQAFRSHRWTHVYRTYYEKSPIYGVSRAYCGDNGAEVFIYRSFDHGTSWQVSSISMHYLSSFLTLRMESDGNGEIIVRSDNDPDPVGGHHVYRTTDWGATWSAPVFSESILVPPLTTPDYRAPYVSPARVMQGITAEHERSQDQH